MRGRGSADRESFNSPDPLCGHPQRGYEKQPFHVSSASMSSESFSYLDHAATSPLLPEALEAMMPWLTSEFGNPSAVYGKGRRARHALESSRAKVAELLGVGPAEIVFTSGGSESNNTVLQPGLFPGRGVVTSAMEHEAVLEPVRRWSDHKILRPTAEGVVTTELLDRADLSGVGLATFMTVNNEIGAINPIMELAAWCHDHDMLIHTDAAQAARTLDLKPVAGAVDYLSLTGHKFGGPKGIGVLVIKAGAPHAPMILGGGQEQERRSGTENVAYAVGLARALEMADAERDSFVQTCRELKARLVAGLEDRFPGRYTVISPEGKSSPHIINIVLRGTDGTGLDGEMLILGLDIEGIAVSAGSACSSGTMKVSHVLAAIGLDAVEARGALRVSLGPTTTGADIDHLLASLESVLGRMKG